MSEKLEKCPFCGREAEASERTGGWTAGCVKHYMDELIKTGVIGPPCLRTSFGIMTDLYTTKEEAIAAWNSRVLPPWVMGLVRLSKRYLCTSRNKRPMEQCGECDDKELCALFDSIPKGVQDVKEPEPVGYEDCPECGSDETYYERFVPGKPKGVVACQDCGWTRDPVPCDIDEGMYAMSKKRCKRLAAKDALPAWAVDLVRAVEIQFKQHDHARQRLCPVCTAYCAIPAAVREEKKARTVTVCDSCLQASCWQGKFMCDDAPSSGTVEKTVAELDALALEHPSYWKDQSRDAGKKD